MSKLYGSTGGDGRAKQQNRCAQREVWAAGRSWDGSIIAHIWIEDDGTHKASLEVADGSETHGRVLWRGSLAALRDAERVEVVRRAD